MQSLNFKNMMAGLSIGLFSFHIYMVKNYEITPKDFSNSISRLPADESRSSCNIVDTEARFSQLECAIIIEYSPTTADTDKNLTITFKYRGQTEVIRLRSEREVTEVTRVSGIGADFAEYQASFADDYALIVENLQDAQSTINRELAAGGVGTAPATSTDAGAESGEQELAAAAPAGGDTDAEEQTPAATASIDGDATDTTEQELAGTDTPATQQTAEVIKISSAEQDEGEGEPAPTDKDQIFEDYRELKDSNDCSVDSDLIEKARQEYRVARLLNRNSLSDSRRRRAERALRNLQRILEEAEESRIDPDNRTTADETRQVLNCRIQQARRLRGAEQVRYYEDNIRPIVREELSLDSSEALDSDTIASLGSLGSSSSVPQFSRLINSDFEAANFARQHNQLSAEITQLQSLRDSLQPTDPRRAQIELEISTRQNALELARDRFKNWSANEPLEALDFINSATQFWGAKLTGFDAQNPLGFPNTNPVAAERLSVNSEFQASQAVASGNQASVDSLDSILGKIRAAAQEITSVRTQAVQSHRASRADAPKASSTGVPTYGSAVESVQ